MIIFHRTIFGCRVVGATAAILLLSMIVIGAADDLVATSEFAATVEHSTNDAFARSVYVKDGRSTMVAFPTGEPSTSEVMVQKIVPKTIVAGEAFRAEIIVTNLTDLPLFDVRLIDQVSDDFKVSAASIRPDRATESNLEWNLGILGPRKSYFIQLEASTADPNTIALCPEVEYEPRVCLAVRIGDARGSAVNTPRDYSAYDLFTERQPRKSPPNYVLDRQVRETRAVREEVQGGGGAGPSPNLQEGERVYATVNKVLVPINTNVLDQPFSRRTRPMRRRLIFSLRPKSHGSIYVGRPTQFQVEVRHVNGPPVDDVQLIVAMPGQIRTIDDRTVFQAGLGSTRIGDTRTVTIPLLAHVAGRHQLMTALRGPQGVSFPLEPIVLDVIGPKLEVRHQVLPKLSDSDPTRVEFRMTNSGNAIANDVRFAIRIPQDAQLVEATPKLERRGSLLLSGVSPMEPGQAVRFSMAFVAADVDSFEFASFANCADLLPVEYRGVVPTRAVSPIAVEIIDLQDPVSLGDVVTYRVTLVNQGVSPTSPTQVYFQFGEGLTFDSCDPRGSTVKKLEDKRILMDSVTSLQPGATVTWYPKFKVSGKDNCLLRVTAARNPPIKPTVDIEVTNTIAD